MLHQEHRHGFYLLLGLCLHPLTSAAIQGAPSMIFRVLRSVPSGTSSPGLPEITTVPSLIGCLNTRWLVAFRFFITHPACSARLINSRTFTRQPLSLRATSRP